MKCIVDTDEEVLNAISARIHTALGVSDATYVAEGYCTCFVHPTESKFGLLIKETEPYLTLITNELTPEEQAKIEVIDPIEWFESEGQDPI
jgi:hypothetical protein